MHYHEINNVHKTNNESLLISTLYVTLAGITKKLNPRFGGNLDLGWVCKIKPGGGVDVLFRLTKVCIFKPKI